MKVAPKKHLGQHFLTDPSVCLDMVNAITFERGAKCIVEIGPGTGALTKYLLPLEKELHVYEVDSESIAYLLIHFPKTFKIHEKDFLRAKLEEDVSFPAVLVGNFPYNISSQILFKLYDYKEDFPEMVGMFQKEVAERISSPPGSKKYGILSVLLQAFYDIEYLFTILPEKFNPPPKVDSGVIRMVRNDVKQLPIDEGFFKTVVKAAFNQRRKTLRNSLKGIGEVPEEWSGLRPEQMSVDAFIRLTSALSKQKSE